MLEYHTGATIRLPIVSWERRFIDMQSSDAGQGEVEANQVGSGNRSAGQPEGDDYSESAGEEDGSGFIDVAQSNDTGKGEAEVGSGDQSAGQPEGDDSESGGEGDGNRRGADGLYGVMLMSSTHHRFAGLFTIRKPGALPVTQLLVRGSPAMWGQKSILVLQRVP